MQNEILWCEKYRPKTVAECILPDRYKKTFQEYVERKEIPHLILSGSPGVGKTTIAKALCNEVGCDFLFLNGSDENGIDTFRTKIKNYASSISLTGSKKVIIIDEADYMNATSLQPALRCALEEFAHNCSFIMTCNYKYKIVEPLHSRCAVIDFDIIPAERKNMMAQQMKRLSSILNTENIKFDNSVMIELVKIHFPDFRKILNEVQRYSVSGTIDAGILSNSIDNSLDDLIQSLSSKNFSTMRKWVSENNIDDSVKLFRKIYDSLYDIMDKTTIPAAVIILAKYQYQSAFCADQELNTVACLTELMCECSFNV